jgi:hypothetical protein
VSTHKSYTYLRGERPFRCCEKPATRPQAPRRAREAGANGQRASIGTHSDDSTTLLLSRLLLVSTLPTLLLLARVLGGTQHRGQRPQGKTNKYESKVGGDAYSFYLF